MMNDLDAMGVEPWLPHTSRKGLNKGFDECAEVGGFSWKLPLLLPAWPV
jgi:hypothetical protein